MGGKSSDVTPEESDERGIKRKAEEEADEERVRPSNQRTGGAGMPQEGGMEEDSEEEVGEGEEGGG